MGFQYFKNKFPLNLKSFYYNVNFRSFSKQFQFKKCYEILKISENSDQEQIRAAYLKLVKIYHPDSGSNEASADKFSEIDWAFKTLINKKSKERWGVEESNTQDDDIQEQDIQHTAPQHRQYLSYEGYGEGNQFQRQKQYSKRRAIQAAENVQQHRISKAIAKDGELLDKSNVKHKIKTRYGIDRLVEDLIQESMSKGEFNNLSGTGKPLSNHENRNPYVDFITHKINQVLIENGFTPEWITLQKEIRNEIMILRNSLLNERTYFNCYPLNHSEHLEWLKVVKKYEKLTENINKKIDKFNLVVPVLNRQIIQIRLDKEAEKVLMNGKNCKDMELLGRRLQRNNNTERNSNRFGTEGIVNIVGLITNLFKK